LRKIITPSRRERGQTDVHPVHDIIKLGIIEVEMENDDIEEGRRDLQVSSPHEMELKRRVQESWIGFIRCSVSDGEITPQFRVLYESGQ
jgi:hypothetical protein